MEALKQRIRDEGRILPGNVIKVDGFLNHQVDPAFLQDIAAELARHFDLSQVTKVLTAEASGIPLATVCALQWGKPMVFAKKAKSANMAADLYASEIQSYTYGKSATLVVSKQWLGPQDRVLIVDDFMARGSCMLGLIDLVHQAGAVLCGIGVAVEKGFQGGGDHLRSLGYGLKSMAIIDQADENGFRFRDQ